MKPFKLVILFAAVTLFAIACNTTTTNQPGNNNNATVTATPAASPAQTSATPADEFASIRPVYAAECARCHGINGDGGTVEILKKKLKVPSLKTGHALDHTEEQLAKQISDGGDGMPAYKDKLKKEEIDTLVRLIRKEFQGGAPPKASRPTPPKT